MSMGWTGNENLRVRVSSKREKAVAASLLGKLLLEMGVSHEEASCLAAHELRHALAHDGSGHIGLITNDHALEAYYQPEDYEQLSYEDRKKIAEAGGLENMSPVDRGVARKPSR